MHEVNSYNERITGNRSDIPTDCNNIFFYNQGADPVKVFIGQTGHYTLLNQYQGFGISHGKDGIERSKVKVLFTGTNKDLVVTRSVYEKCKA